MCYNQNKCEIAALRNDGRKFFRSAGEEENVDYYVNSHTTMPSCLLELGYIDNVEDNSLFTRYQVQYAQATAQGIAATLDQMIQAGALEDRRDTTE